MGRPANSKNGGPNGTAAGKHGNCRAPKTTKISVSKTQSSPSGSSTTEGKNVTGKPDRAQFNFPYDVRLNGFSSLLNAVTKGSPKIKRILMDEADYIMECRVCRNLFRSLPNFITHKQTYCKKVFDSTWSIGLSNLIQSSDTAYNIEYEVDPELLIVDNDKYNTSAAAPESSLTSLRQATHSRSPYEFYDELSTRLNMSKNPSPLENGTPSLDSNTGQSSKHETIRLGIKPLVERPCGTIVLQHRILSDPSNCDNIRSYMYGATDKDTAILGPDGKVIYTGPSKGIEAVVSKLTAKLNTMENSFTSDAFSMTISCETCNTVFDSDKALRQHKRESLDCGQTWGFKSPGAESAKTKGAPENPAIPPKRLKFTENALSKCFTYVKPKRNPQNQMLRSPKKSLSPVKKIKKKYSKLDSSCIQEKADQTVTQTPDNSLCCNRCSRSFGTKHEMSLHLAMCNGVINYALLRNSEPVEEKIRISVRNNHDEFKTSSVSSNSLSETIDNDDSISDPVSSNESQVTTPTHSPTPQVKMIKSSKDLGALSCGDNAEVNNNKQYKNGYCSQPESENSSMTKDVDGLPVLPPSIVLKCKSNTEETERDKRSDTISFDSGVSSDSARSIVTRQEVSQALNSRKQKSPKSRRKPSDVLVSDQVTKRLEKGIEIRRTRPPLPGKAMKPNLRKTVAARLRKSRRMLRVRASQV